MKLIAIYNSHVVAFADSPEELAEALHTDGLTIDDIKCEVVIYTVEKVPFTVRDKQVAAPFELIV